jgi:hypothetical protein
VLAGPFAVRGARVPSANPFHRLAAAAALTLFAACGGGGGGGGGGTITLRFQTSVTDVQRAAFEDARNRLEKIITGGWKSVKVNSLDCPGTPTPITVNETINGLVIEVFAADLGSNGILAQSGPCIVRESDKIPLVAVMTINTNSSITWGTRLPTVVQHEMFHALGFGTVWPDVTPPLLSGAGSADSAFVGSQALAAAKSANGAPAGWASVPVENSGGSGTQDAHWRETVFGNELMTGYISSTINPLSLTTIESMADLGYSVDPSQADPFTIPNPSGALREAGAEPLLHLGDDILHVQPVLVDD